MPTSRLFAYNTGSLISGTTQVGSIAISKSPSLNYSQGVGGVRWWNGPNEDLGYVITHTTPSGTQPYTRLNQVLLNYCQNPNILLPNDTQFC